MWNRTEPGFKIALRRSPTKFYVYSELFKAGKYIIDTDINELVTNHKDNVDTWKGLIKDYDAENERLKKEDKSFSSLGKYFTNKTDQPDEKKTPKKEKKESFLGNLLKGIKGKIKGKKLRF